MQVITDRKVFYRTARMEHGQACRFARCIRSNSRFDDVSVEENPQVKGERRYFVQYRPVSRVRQRAMVDGQQNARVERGLRDDAFVIVEDPDSTQPFAWCHSLDSGETYEVTAYDCTCPDHRYRLAGTGISCKHQVAYRAAMERDAVGRFEPSTALTA